MGRLTFVCWNKHNQRGDKPFKKGAVGIGLVRALSATVMVFLVLGFVVALTNQPVYDFNYVIMVTIMASAAFGGAGAGVAASIRGWQHGGFTGMIYGMVLVVAGALLGLPIVVDPVLMTVALALLGTVGGIIGVNLPKGGRGIGKRRFLRGN
ncbi:TIGR04086 family membrane protein [Desulforamulus aeronauticus]|uniref:Putative membrane protein, TIGR04086 family n=1 Tax=Desulforamulus aeronauticus DSM 10349 TaxID=1121421 RepID=A0A1M6TW04_9FIRM|nr:TIGR04086 family membrane protein [Desulforamulus aeronauticus]SHK61202.1 putative membrane protein, TIGR04086 family [Desulforamulus aeronauticus DSM 10349]